MRLLLQRFNWFNRSKARGAKLARQWALLGFHVTQLNEVGRMEYDRVLDSLVGFCADTQANADAAEMAPRMGKGEMN